MAQRHRTIAVWFTLCALAALLPACGGGGSGGSVGGGTPSPTGGPTGGTRMGGAIQGNPLPLTSTSSVSTLAGTAVSADGTTGPAANFNGSQGVVWVSSSSTVAYVTDGYSYTVRKIDTATGTVTTVAGLAGTKGNTDATGTAARFGFLGGITSDGTNLYVADTGNCTLRKIAPSGGATLATVTASTAVVSTLAGAGPGTGCGEVDATGTAAKFNVPTGITTDTINLYVSDAMGQTVRKIAPSSGTLASMTSVNAVVSTLAGGSVGSLDGTGTAAQFNSPNALTTDDTNLYVADTNNHKIRRIAPSSGTLATMTAATAAVSTLAGSIAGDLDATGTSAQFNTPTGISTNASASFNGALFVAESNGQVIRKIVPSGTTLAAMTSANANVSTLAGTAAATGSADGTGTAASFRYPHAIAAAVGINSLLVADTDNHTVRQIAPVAGTLINMTSTNAVVSTRASTAVGTDGTGAAARFGRGDNAAYTTDGTYLYVADASDDTIRRVTIASGAVITLAGAPGQIGTTDGTGIVARFNGPRGITTDGNAIFVADSASHTIRKIAPITGYTLATMTSATAKVITVAGTAGSSGLTDGGGTGTATPALFHTPEGLTTDGVNLYVSDTLNHEIRRIAATGVPLAAMTNSTAQVTTLAGTGATGNLDATGTAAAFSSPNGLTTDGIALYVDDTGNNEIRKILPAGGTLAAMTSANAAVTTLAGSTAGHADGSGATALFDMPTGITTDGSTLYVTDYLSDTVRTVKPASGALSAMTLATTTVATLAGTVNVTAVTDATVTAAAFWNPSGITTDGSRLLVGDANGGTVRAIH